jgi:hypothetical protein
MCSLMARRRALITASTTGRLIGTPTHDPTERKAAAMDDKWMVRWLRATALALEAYESEAVRLAVANEARVVADRLEAAQTPRNGPQSDATAPTGVGDAMELLRWLHDSGVFKVEEVVGHARVVPEWGGGGSYQRFHYLPPHLVDIARQLTTPAAQEHDT